MKKILLLLIIPLVANSDTTGNLITNGTFDDGTTGWTLSGDAVRISDCCPGGHDLEFGASGSIEQTFDLIDDPHITQAMLNNGITLNSTVEIQNGECGVQGCWGGSGSADKTIVRLQILDENSNVLAVTTQERYDVTGINGEDYSDSVSYTGIGSNMGNIYIFGSDSSGGSASLLGPNVDNISVTMTYDPVVLTTAQTSQISTAVEEIEEIEEYKFEEIKFEEIKFEEVKIEEYKEPEFSLVKFFEEEIVTGVINIFEEIKYEEPKTIETFTTEVESFEEENINNETTNESFEETEVAVESGSTSESRNANVSSETNAQSEESSGEESNIASRETQQNSNADTDSTGSIESNAEVQDMAEESIQLSIDDIRREVENTVTQIDQQLITTQTLVAKVMSNDDILDEYNSKNQSIFDNQVNIDGGNIDDYYQRDYNDARTIYVQAQNQYNDPAFLYQRKVEKAVENRIRAEQHLRRIRGY